MVLSVVWVCCLVEVVFSQYCATYRHFLNDGRASNLLILDEVLVSQDSEEQKTSSTLFSK